MKKNEKNKAISKRLWVVKNRLKQSLALGGILIVTLSLSGCEKFVETGVSAETKSTIQTISETIALDNQEKKSKTNTDTDKYSDLESKLNNLETMLEENNINNYITYGIIDFDNNGTEEFFAVFSKGTQGYNEVRFYNIDNYYNIRFLFSTVGFSRDGKTYFMFDNVSKQLLIFSNYEHSFFLKNEKIEAVNKNGDVSELFESIWKANSFDDEFEQTDVYINSMEVPLNEYNIAYDNFINEVYYDMLYIYDGKLFCGSNLVCETDVFMKYVLNKENNNYE